MFVGEDNEEILCEIYNPLPTTTTTSQPPRTTDLSIVMAGCVHNGTFTDKTQYVTTLFVGDLYVCCHHDFIWLYR